MSATRLHHVGFVVTSISKYAERMARSISVEWDGVIVHDPLQFVRVTFLPSNDPLHSTIELIEPASPRSPVRRFAEAGGGLHHVCYEVDDLAGQIAHSEKCGAALVRVPLPAAAFGGRRIAWLKTAEGLLVEFLENPPVTVLQNSL